MTDREFPLSAHHRVLEEACRDLLSETYADDPRSLGVQWRLFEAAIEAHLAEEEQRLLPAYAEAAPEDAALIRAEHERIRQLLSQLGIEVDLHAIRAHSVEALVDELQRHARHEDAVFYPWAASHAEAPSPEPAGAHPT
jgi:hemerythrin-like domain-containing protein